MNRPIIIGVVLFLVALGVVLFALKRPGRNVANPPPAAQPGSSAPAVSGSPATQPSSRRINVFLFFNEQNSESLVTESRFVPYHEALRDQAFEVMKTLVQGSEEGNVSTIPEGTQVLDLFISRDGVAYVDFSEQLSSKHAGGSLAEINTVYAIVNTLTLNFPQIKRVQILVNDLAVDTLTGHIDLSHPLAQDLSMVSNEAEASAPVAEAPAPQTTM